ncbi:F-box protein At1g20360-like [Castanea sativa]|uniref:F-box protein At1g20360-like n=1 Tax=Castanea sativa TaxID=21020 RepID=UPI003F65466C
MEDLCDNLFDDILYRLLLKSVVTCKSISKRFNTFISDPGFESKLFLYNSCIFHCTKDFPNFYFKVPLYPPNSDKATESSVKLPRRFKVLAYCSGLLLLFPTEGVLVLNPVTKRHQIIDIFHYDAIGRSSTKYTCMVMSNFNNDVLPIYSHGTLHWIRKCNDILAFDIEKEEARIIELPLNLPLPFEYWTSWFGVVNGLLTLISTSRENGEFCLYDIATDKWRKIGIVWAILDNIRAFVPFVPSLAEIKTTTWPDVSTRVVQSIHKLSLLLGAGVTLKKDVLQLKWAEPNSYSKDL